MCSCPHPILCLLAAPGPVTPLVAVWQTQADDIACDEEKAAETRTHAELRGSLASVPAAGSDQGSADVLGVGG